MTSFLKNRPAVGATLAAMGVFIGMQAASAAVSVIFRICFQNPQTSGLVSMFSMILIVLFAPLARKMVIRFGKKELSVVGSICCIAGDLLMFAAPPGITPVSQGNTGIGLIVCITAQLVMAPGMGYVNNSARMPAACSQPSTSTCSPGVSPLNCASWQ